MKQPIFLLKFVKVSERKKSSQVSSPVTATYFYLRGINTLSGETTLSDLFCPPSEKTSKGKTIDPLGSKSFPFREENCLFRKELVCQSAKMKSNDFSLVKNDNNKLPNVSRTLQNFSDKQIYH